LDLGIAEQTGNFSGGDILAEITYEVYVLVSGRWTIESRYTNMEREAAIDDAKSMHSNPSVKAVKVIKETYDASTNSTIEATVFTTESVADMPSRGGSDFADMEVNVGGGTDFADMTFDTDSLNDYDDPMPAPQTRKVKKKVKAAGKSPIATIFLKIMMITGFSIGFALLMTYFSTEGYFG
jgi:hypothetical protein